VANVEDEDEELFAGAIVYCPTCCSNMDIDEEGWVDVTCNNCSTQFKVKIDRRIIAEYSMFG
jgi:hypothetical protein